MHNNQPLVSVGIPTYNRPEGLRRILTCITRQSYRNLQIIVADNCSENEDVRKVVDEFSRNDARIIYYRHSENKGAVYNFRFVLESATGEYFMWAADDDQFSENYIESNFLNIQSDPKILGSYGIMQHEGDEGNNIPPVLYDLNGRIKRIRKYLRKPDYNMCFYSLFKTAIVKKLKIENYGYFAGDWFFISKILQHGKITATTNTHVIRGTGGLSSNYFKLLEFYYKKSRLKYIPFLKPTLIYLRQDFFSALLNIDILLYYNFMFAEIAWNIYFPGKLNKLKGINRRVKKLVEHCVFFNDRFIYKIVSY